jgi:hypothetical protein
MQPFRFRLSIDAFVELLWLRVRIDDLREKTAKMSLRDPDSHDGSFRNGIGNVPFALSKRLSVSSARDSGERFRSTALAGCELETRPISDEDDVGVRSRAQSSWIDPRHVLN